MRIRIKNQLLLVCEDIDLTEISNIEFYVKQNGFFGIYTPNVVSDTQMTVEIPYKDAMRLRHGEVRLQFAFVDKNGVPDASDIVIESAKDFLKEAGYDPV